MNKISQTISWVFLPFSMPIYALLIAFYIESYSFKSYNYNLWILNDDAKSALLSIFFIFTVVAPGLSYIVLRKQNIISSIEMDERKERFVPISIMFLYCLALFILMFFKLNSSEFPEIIYLFPLSGAFSSLLMLVINNFIKISLHACGAGIFLGFLLAYFGHLSFYNFYIIPLSIILCGTILSARFYLQKHNIIELAAGFFTGGLTTFVFCYFLN
jgi:hypothetical protein